MSDLHLGERWGEVESLVHARFGAWIEQQGLEIEDVLQELAVKLLRHEDGPRESFRGREDGSGWSSWICKAAWQVVANRQAKSTRRGRHHGTTRVMDTSSVYSAEDRGTTNGGVYACDPARAAQTTWDETAHADAMDLRLGWRLWEID